MTELINIYEVKDIEFYLAKLKNDIKESKDMLNKTFFNSLEMSSNNEFVRDKDAQELKDFLN